MFSVCKILFSEKQSCLQKRFFVVGLNHKLKYDIWSRVWVCFSDTNLATGLRTKAKRTPKKCCGPKKRENETMECQTHVMMQTFNDDFFHWKNESFILNKHYYHSPHHHQLVILEADVFATSTSRVRVSSAGHHHQRHNPSHDQIIFCSLSI